jgi:hypothetical protein
MSPVADPVVREALDRYKRALRWAEFIKRLPKIYRGK